jgi:hypothetical protein
MLAMGYRSPNDDANKDQQAPPDEFSTIGWSGRIRCSLQQQLYDRCHLQLLYAV